MSRRGCSCGSLRLRQNCLLNDPPLFSKHPVRAQFSCLLGGFGIFGCLYECLSNISVWGRALPNSRQEMAAFNAEETRSTGSASTGVAAGRAAVISPLKDPGWHSGGKGSGLQAPFLAWFVVVAPQANPAMQRKP